MGFVRTYHVEKKITTIVCGSSAGPTYGGVFRFVGLPSLRSWCGFGTPQDGCGSQSGGTSRGFLITVPCRRGEAARMDWAQVDLAAAEWRQPGRLTKNRDPHRLHLHPLAMDVLGERQKATGGKGLVFPAPLSGKPVDTFTDIKSELIQATAGEDAGIEGWTWHDFRRSFATALGEAGISEAVADAVLNHRQSATRGGVLGVYQRASRWPEQVKAMQLWGRMLSAAIEGREAGAEVVLLPARAG
jgi:Phage integrase family